MADASSTARTADADRASDAPPPPGELSTELGLLSLAVIWGVNFSVIKVALAEIPPFAFNALRFPLASAVLYLLLRLSRRRRPPLLPRRGDVPRVLALGILGNVVYQAFFIVGVDLTTAGNASLLLATTPVWTLLLSVALGHERPPVTVWLGVAATVGGMALVVVGGRRAALGGGHLVGDLLMIGSSVAWSLYTVGSRTLVRRYGALPVTAWTLWVGTVGLVVMGIPALGRVELGSVSALAWGGVAYAGMLAISVAYLLWYRGVERLGNARTAVYSNLVPVVALVVAWLWLSEVPTGLQLAGAAVVLGGLTLTRVARHRPRPTALRGAEPAGG